MKTILKYLLLSAIRDKLFLAIFLSIISAFAVSNLIGFTALSEEAYMQTAIFAGSAKIILIFGMVIFISFNVNKSFENKEIPFILSKDVSREMFIFSYWLGFNIISTFLLLIVMIILFAFSPVNFLGSLQWFLSLESEIMIISMFTLLSNLILQSAIFSIFLSSGFYIIAKLMGFFLDVFSSPSSNQIISFIITVSHFVLNIISSLIPRLDVFSQTKWLIYGPDFYLFKIILLQSLIFIPIIFMMAFYDFKNKQF